jgi:biopolymer transport protein TolR
MAGFASNKPNAPITGINVTPLVDITLVLLIIFMVTAKLVVSRGMPVDLPKAATGGEVQQVFSLTLTSSGKLTVNGAPIESDQELHRRAKNALAEDPELRAVIQADGDVPHRRVIGALDVLRQAGLTRIAFGVERGEPVTPELSKTPASKSEAP